MCKIRTILNNLYFIIVVSTLIACASSPIPNANYSVLVKLANIEGEFVWNEKLKRHVYSEMELVENALALEDRNELISILVNCIDNPTSSNSILNGRNVSLGIMCYQGLSQTAYYEVEDRTGDIKSSWPGHILPTANPDELLEAKRAWLEVVASKSYILY